MSKQPFAFRYATASMQRAAAIPADEVFARVLTAIKTLQAMPDAERRFLLAGQGSWLGKMGSVLTWHDANAAEDKNLEPLHRVHVEIPKDIAEFFGLPGDKVDRDPDAPPMPMRVGDVSQARVDFRSERMSDRMKRRGIKPVKYVPAIGPFPEKEPEQSREMFRPTSAQVSDALVAGDWFAKVALLRDDRYCPKAERLIANVDQFEVRFAKFKAGGRRSFLVDDQRVLVWLAKGFSLRAIGLRLELSGDEMEIRLNEIRRSLFRIANGAARLADPEQRSRDRRRKAHCAES